jgi:Mn2+/Fe2+ NRAMP family transporter
VLSEAFGWRYGLDHRPTTAKQFYGVIVAASVIGMLINFVGINQPLDALFWTAVINGFVAPPLLLMIMLVSNNRRVMGDRVNGIGLNVLGWLATAAMFVAAAAMVITTWVLPS